MADWRKVRLGEVCRFKYGVMPKKSDLASEGYPVYSGYRHVGFSPSYHYADPEIIVVARGVGGTGDIKMTPPFCFLTNLSIAILLENAEVFKPFLFYRLSATTLWELRTGSAQAQITIERLKDFEIEFPPLQTQKRIAGILSAYDELIENSQQRIKILESMARNLYREWFVHFRFPGHEKLPRVASLLGDIPQDWEVKRVVDAFEISGGGTPSRKEAEYWDGGIIQWFSPSDLTGAGTMFMDDSGDHITKLGLAKSSARLFPARSVMLTSRATIGAIAINTHEACTNQGFITCMPNESVPLHFLFHWLTENVPTFQRMASGATFKEISRGVFKTIEFLHPPTKLVRHFEDTVTPMAEQALSIQRQIQNLRKTRNLLLPRLLSGQINLKEN
jgi:type I restriction enzyme S subunit